MFDHQFELQAVQGVSQSIPARGNAVFYYEETSGAVDAAVIVRAEGGGGGSFVLRPGEGVELPESASSFTVSNKTGTSTIAGILKIGEGRFAGKNIAGSVTVSNFPVQSGPHDQSGVTITNADAQILAANADREYLLIQNQHATLDLYLRTDGAAAVADATAMRLPPGAVWEPELVPTGEIRGIRSGAAATASVHVIEG